MQDITLCGMTFSYWADISLDFSRIRTISYSATIVVKDQYFLFDYRVSPDGSRSLTTKLVPIDSFDGKAIYSDSMGKLLPQIVDVLEEHAEYTIERNPDPIIADRLIRLIEGHKTQIQDDLEHVELGALTISRMEDRLKELRPNEK